MYYYGLSSSSRLSPHTWNLSSSSRRRRQCSRRTNNTSHGGTSTIYRPEGTSCRRRRGCGGWWGGGCLLLLLLRGTLPVPTVRGAAVVLAQQPQDRCVDEDTSSTTTSTVVAAEDNDHNVAAAAASASTRNEASTADATSTVDPTIKDPHEVEHAENGENDATSSPSTSSESNAASSTSSSWEESLPRQGRVYLMDSLEHLQKTLEQQHHEQQQQQQQQQAGRHDESSSIYWLVYLEAAPDEEPAATCAFSLWPIVESVADWLWLDYDLAATRKSSSSSSVSVTPRIRCAALSLTLVELQWLQEELGLQATPAIILVSSNNHNHNSQKEEEEDFAANTVLLDYMGLLGTAQQLYDGVTHYFDVLEWTSTLTAAMNQTTTTTTDGTPATDGTRPTTASHDKEDPSDRRSSSTLATLWDLPLPSFPHLDQVHQFLYHVVPDRLWQRAARASHALPVLPSSSSKRQRQVVEWLFRQRDENMAKNATTDSNDTTAGFLRLIVQTRCRSSASGGSNRQLESDYQNTMDKFAHTQILRRNHLFVVVNMGDDHDEKDEGKYSCESSRVDVWDIPVQYYYNSSLSNNTSRSSVAPFWTDPHVPHFRHELRNSNGTLVQFLIHVCTDLILWWDRQTVAPIAFGEHRRVHAVLVVDVHSENVVADSDHAEPTDRTSRDGTASSSSSSLFMDSPHWRTQRAAVQEFRAACQQHRRSLAMTDDNSNNQHAILDRDMVCLVVPSTEIRVVTTLGVDWWTRLDRLAMDKDRVKENASHSSSSNSSRSSREQLPALLITDQRYSGTRRYYYDQRGERYQGYTGFVSTFWQGQLQYEIKTSPQKSYTNQAGVRILTAESFEGELFPTSATTTIRVDDDGKEPQLEQQQQQSQHALILFIAPTCGHCKRLLVIWNHLAKLLRHIGWHTFLTLYQVDVTENDVATTLNVTVEWLPDLYYLGRISSSTVDQQQEPKMIRYNHSDAVGDSIEILEWLVHLDEFANAERASQLWSDLVEKQQQPEIKKH